MLALALHAGTPTCTEYLMSRILLYHANRVKLSLSIDLWMGSPSSVVLPQILMSHLEFLFSPVLKCWSSVMMGKYRYWVNVVAAARWQANAPFLFHVTWHGTSPIQSQALWDLSAGAGRGWRAKPNSIIVLSVVLQPNIHPSPCLCFLYPPS